MRVPIACTLTVEEQPDRIAEWRAFFATHVTALEELTPAGAWLRLAEGDAPVLAAADLAQREQACCAFFDFAIQLRADGRFLAVAVPDDAGPVLHDFLALLPDSLRP
jgi:hypothetical protein